MSAERFGGASGTHAKLLLVRNQRLAAALERVLTALHTAGFSLEGAEPMAALELGAAVGDAHLLLKERST